MVNNAISVKRASGYYMFSSIFNNAISLLVVPVFTRLLDTSDYGLVTTYNSWVAILSMIVGFAMHMGIRSAFVDYEDKIDEFLSTTIFFTVISSFVLMMGSIFFIKIIGIRINIDMLCICFVNSLCTAVIADYSMYLMMKFEYKQRTALLILPNLLAIILSLILLLFVLKNNLYWGRIISIAFSNLLATLIIFVLCMKRNRKIWNASFIKYGLKISLPLVVHGISMNILSQSDRTMITLLADSSQTGIYSLIYNYGTLTTVLLTAFDGVWIPWFTTQLKERKIYEINHVASKYILLMTLMCVGFILVGPEGVKILASEKYWDGIKIIPPLVLSCYFMFLYSMYVNVEHFYKQTVSVSINTVIAAFINILLNYALIPHYGYYAAAFTTLVAYIIAYFLHMRCAKRYEKDLYHKKDYLKYFLLVIGAGCIFYCFMDYWIIRWGILFIEISYFVIIERKTIYNFIRR